MSRAVGIDLGTTNSVVAVLEGGEPTVIANAEGGQGYFQHRFDVYGREGEPCRGDDCAGLVARIVQGGRSTFYCPSCQKR